MLFRSQTPVTPVEPEQKPVTPVQPEQKPVTPVEPEQTPVTPVQPEQKPVTPVQPEQTPVTPVEPEQTPVTPETPVVPVTPVTPETPVVPGQTVITPIVPAQPEDTSIIISYMGSVVTNSDIVLYAKKADGKDLQNAVWSIANDGGTMSSIEKNILRATNKGNVIVKVTISNGTGLPKIRTKMITIV